jgi:hypothetical protein
VTLFPGLLLALLVLLRVGVLAEELLPSVYEMGKLSQMLVYEVGVRPQLLEGHESLGLLALVSDAQAVGFF